VSGLVGAIVAGGAATRFNGEPKGLHRVGGIRIIDRVAAALRATTSELMIVSNASDASEWLPDVPVHADVRPERGSLIGIHTALTYGSGDVLVVAWDMPFVSTQLLRLIRDRARDDVPAVFPEGPSGPEPFCALYTPACREIIEAAIDAGELRLSDLTARLRGRHVIPVGEIARLGDPATLLFNVNTLADLAHAEAIDAAR
jgi:molybdopterin-guanine dinucleotide biosynthesis protein A